MDPSHNKYIIFDVDHTLIDSYSLFYFLASLKPDETIKLSPVELPPCDPADWEYFKRTLDQAYLFWVTAVGEAEDSDHPIGIFRPGLFHVMRRLSDLQKEGVIKGVHLYSNNSYLPTLHFIRDVIHHRIGSTTLIQQTIDWMHPLRVKERTDRLPARFIGKTWDTLAEILRVSPEQVYFVDDLQHRELMDVLGDRYYHVPKYEFRASFERLMEIYSRVLHEARVPVYQFFQTILFLYSNTVDEFYFDYHLSAKENIRNFLRDRTGMTVGQLIVPPTDRGIQQIYECMDRIERSEMCLRIRQEDRPSSSLSDDSQESLSSFSSLSSRKSFTGIQNGFQVRLHTLKNRRKTSRRKRSDIIL